MQRDKAPLSIYYYVHYQPIVCIFRGSTDPLCPGLASWLVPIIPNISLSCKMSYPLYNILIGRALKGTSPSLLGL